MEKYDTIRDFNESVGIMPVIDSVVKAIPMFWPITLFFFWLFFTASSYFVILKTTGKKRFFQSWTAVSFVSFVISLLLASNNTATITYLNGYWVGFYILMTLISYYLLTKYK